MNSLKLLKKIVETGVVFASISACVHGPMVKEFPNTANPETEVRLLEADIREAAINQVDVFSPDNFSKAQELLKAATKSMGNETSAKDTLHEVAEGRAYLKLANEVVKRSYVNMEEVVQARKQALSSGAQNYFIKDFNKADDNLKNVTSDLEKNKLKSTAQNRGELQAAYLDLELRGIKQKNLGEATQTIALAVEQGAKDFAPRSLAIAEKSYKDADAFITGNRHYEEIEELSQDVTDSAKHLLKITRDSKAGKKRSSEEIALQMEKSSNSNINMQKQLNEEQVNNEDLSADNQVLQVDKALTERFDSARAEFNPNEAEVYKKGGVLVIRLRGLKFPTAKAVLKEPDFKLLAKVNKVIRDFGNSSVVVEGHTDSIGSQVANEKLSIARATAVREYLVSNEAIDGQKITAVGYGYLKPLASNKTSADRAYNRRVDVLIKPQDPNTN